MRRRWKIACELMEAWTMLDNGHSFVPYAFSFVIFPSLVILFQVLYYLISMQCHTFLNGQIGIGAGVESFQETYERVSCDQIWKVHH